MSKETSDLIYVVFFFLFYVGGIALFLLFVRALFIGALLYFGTKLAVPAVKKYTKFVKKEWDKAE